MEKITQLSRLKIRWLTTKALMLMLFGFFLPNLNVQAQTYCTPAYTSGCTWGDDLNSVVLNGHGTSVLSDLNTGCGTTSYSDKTTLFTAVDLMQSITYPVQLNTTYGSPTYELASIWIDFNNDGTFAATEKLLTDLPLAQTPSFATGNITIPVNAPTGIHRMRVRVIYSTTGVDACTNASYGETHDYNVNILALPPCSGTPTAGTISATTRTCNSQPFTLSTAGATIAGNMTYQWESSPAGAGTWTAITGATGTSWTVTNQTANTDYRFVVTCNTSSGTNTSNVVTVNQVSAVSASFFEGFENTPTGGYNNSTVPECWTYLVGSGSGYGYTSTSAAKTGSKGFYTYPYNNTELFLISPETVNLGNGTKQLRFSVNLPYSGYTNTKVEVYRMNAASGTATKTLIQSIPLTTTGWNEYIVPLPVTTDDFFAFSFYGPASQYPNIYLDDVYYEDLSPCIFPMNIAANAITITGATFSWSASQAPGVTGYQWEVRTSGAPGTAGAVATGSTIAPNTTASTNALTGATTYYVYVRSVCGTNNGVWTTFPVKFNTLCPIYAANFFEGFENTPTGGSTNNTVPNCWTYLNKASSGYGYTTTTAGRTGKGFYTYRPNTTGEMLLISPETNNLGNGTKQVRFWARVSSTSYETTQKLGVYTMDDPTATGVLTLVQKNIPLTTTWQEFIIPLPASTDDYFAFSFDSQNGTAYVYLDDIYYEDLSPCIFPMNLQVTGVTQTNATVSWNASMATGVTGYEYEIRTAGAAGSGATGLVQTGVVNAPATSVNITGLNHSTAYTVYIRSKCGATNGLWSPYPVKFNTLCGVFTTSFFEGFENANVGSFNNNTVPTCWTYIKTGPTVNYPNGYVATTAPKTGTKHFYTYRASTHAGESLLVSPETQNLGNGQKRLRFSSRLYFTGTYGQKLNIYSMDGNTASANKTLLKTVVVPSTSYTEFIVYLPLSTTDDYFAFGFDDEAMTKYIFIDNIYYEDAPNCRPIDDATITTTNVGKNSFTVSWQDLFNLNPMAYEVEVRTTGNPGTAGAAFVGTTAVGVTSITATGLAPSTDYKVYVRSVCSSTDQSIWTQMPGTVTTLCNYSDFTSYTSSLALCGEQKAELEAVLADPTYTVAWYDNVTDSTPLYEGSNFVSPNDVTQDRSFWLRSQKIVPNSSVQVGYGTSTGTSIGTFLYRGWGGYRHQYIFTAAELADEGLAAGPITALKFDVVTTGDTQRPDFTISLGSTTNTSASTNLVPNSTLTQVYSNVSQTITTGIMTFTFSTPYVWDGVSNIVVQTNWSVGDYGGSSGALRYHTTSPNRTSLLYGDNQGAAALLATDSPAGSIYGTTSNARPNTVFVGNSGCISPPIEIPVTFAVKPAFELSSTTATSCEGGVSTTPVTITTNLGGYDTFVWTPSAGVSGDAVNGWTFSTTQEQEYVLSATQSNGICEHLKTVRVFAGKKPEANAALASTYDLCKDQVQELKALEPLPASVTIGSGTTTTASTSAVSAFVQSGVYSKQQYIYSASELIAQGLTTSGYITNLSFETINSGASLTNPMYTIKMKLTPNTSFGTTNFDALDLSTVYSKVNHTHTFQGTQLITFDNPFYWDGQSNILVEITQEGMGSGNNAETYYTAVAGTNVGMYATSATDPNPTAGTRTVNRLNATFGLTQSNVTWSPTSNLYLDAATTVPYTAGTNSLKVYVTSPTSMNQVYNAVLTAPSGCELNKAITVNVTDVATPVVQGQTFCQVSPVTDVVVTGAPNATFNFYDSATATTPISTISQTGTYYVEAVQGLCKSVRVPFTATITPLGLPTAQFTQVVCGGGTVSALMASGVSGAQIRWYASATSTTPLSGTQPLVNNTTYYASQTLGTCESGRVSVLVNVNPAPAALTPQTISICGTLTYGAVNLNQLPGSELVWYPSATSQTPIPNMNQILSGTYYVSQKINGCESLRVQVTASSQGSVAAPTAGIQNICGTGTVAQLVAQILPGATAEWYSNATATTPLASTTPLVNATYYVAQRIGNCVSVKVPVAVRVISTSAPAVSPMSMCEGATVGDISLPSPTGTSYNWYLNSTSTTPLLSTDVLQSGIYFVSRVDNGCESLRTQTQITINSRPSSPVGATPQTFTNYGEISSLVMTQPNVVWYATYDDAMKGNNPLAPNMPLVNNTTYYAVIIGTNGCPSLPTPIKAIIVLGVNDFDLSKLKYYPNPVNDLLTITYTDVIKNVEVFDLNGRLVITRNFDNQTVQIDFGNLSSGTYMLNIKTNENSQFVKIVKK